MKKRSIEIEFEEEDLKMFLDMLKLAISKEDFREVLGENFDNAKLILEAFKSKKPFLNFELTRTFICFIATLIQVREIIVPSAPPLIKEPYVG